jgi:hypothetical protein
MSMFTEAINRHPSKSERPMSAFRIVYRHRDDDQLRFEDIEAVEFVQKEPWLLFLDPAGTCRTIRLEDVERIERVHPAPPVPASPPPPSDLPLPGPVPPSTL